MDEPNNVWVSNEQTREAEGAADALPIKLPLPLGLSGLDAIAHAVNTELKESAVATAKETGSAQVTIEIEGIAAEKRLQAALAAAEEVTPPGVEILLVYCGRRVQREAAPAASD